MTRQYIGARYVPIIEGEYNSEKVYEPLTIVTYNGSSYTSKKSVPAGTLPTNTEYWALTGNYNAQVESYREDVVNYKSDTDNAIHALSDRTLNAIQALSDSTLSGRHFLLIGDSLGMGASVNNGVVTTTKGWIGYAMDAIGTSKCTYVSIVGGGFCEPSPYNWEEQLRNAIVASGDKTITDLVILGGTNDIDNSINEVATAMTSLVSYAKSRFTNLRRIACGAFCEPQLSPKVHERYSYIRNLGGVYISDLENLLADPTKYDATKHTHLSEQGYSYYAPYVIDCVVGDHTDYKFDFTNSNLTLSDGITVYHGTPTLHVTVRKDEVEYYMQLNPEDNLDVTAPINQPGVTPVLVYEDTPTFYIHSAPTTPNTRGASIMALDASTATSIIGLGNIVLGSYDLFTTNKIFINGNAIGNAQSARYYIGQSAGGRIKY